MDTKIACAVCGKEMSSINNRHLGSHGMTIDDYKSRYPDAPTMSEASRQRLQERSRNTNKARKGRKRSEAERQAIREGIAKSDRTYHPKGPMSEETKRKLSDKAKADIQSGKRKTRKGAKVSDETRAKISASLSGRKVGPEAAQKAIATRRERGDDLAPFRGRKHTEDTKRLIGEKSRKTAAERRPVRREVMLERIQQSNLVLRNEVTSDVFELQCLACDHLFTRTPQCFQPSKWHTEQCDQCFPIAPTSKAEDELAEFVTSLGVGITRSCRETIGPLELDILTDRGIAIEYCGLYWHSELAGKTRWYHRKKLELCEEKGVRLITVFEDEWRDAKAVVQSMLRNMFGHNNRRIMARKCTAEIISTKEGRAFIADNHVQGGGRANRYYGLRYEGELISVMSFSNNEISRGGTGWDINRFCSLQGTTVQGGAGKLFRSFVRDENPDEVVSYADLRYGTGNVYGTIGFIHEGHTVPNYWYFRANEMIRRHRFGLRKNADDNPTLTEWENRQSEGWNRIWDCGHAKWVWRKPDYSESSNPK
jgi:hypothetical protein